MLLTSVTLQFVIITQFVINYKLRWIATQFVIHRISNCVVMTTRFVMYYKLRQNFIILKYWKWEKKMINGKMHRFNHILIYEFSQTPIYSSSECKSPNQHYNCSERYFAPALLRKPICPSVYWFVCPSLCRKNFNIAHIFWSIKDTCITLMFGMNDPWKKSFQFAPSRDLCFDLDLLQGQFILPTRGQQLSELACKVYIYTVI